MEEIIEHYRQGEYGLAIEKALELRKAGTNIHLDACLCDCYIKANQLDKALLHSIEMHQIANLLFQQKNEEAHLQYVAYLMQNHVLQIGLRVMREWDTPAMRDFTAKWLVNMKKPTEAWQTLARIQNDKPSNLTIFPVVWPIAFGDAVIFNQFISQNKKCYPDSKNLVIAPLNRKDLKELYALNHDIDYLIDITLMPEEEQNRQATLGLLNDGYLNLSRQEAITTGIIRSAVEYAGFVEIVKMRYFPLLQGIDANIIKKPMVYSGKRMWEERARMAMAGEYLPKFGPHINNLEPIKKQIAIHFREGGYGDPARDVNPNYGQSLVDRITELYPDYEIIKLGDKSMSPYIGVRNASHEDLTVGSQVSIIHESALFIGSHSATQMLAAACTDTPIICISYTAQETTKDMKEPNIPKLSYEPLATNVKAVMYNRMFDKDGGEFVPTQMNAGVSRVEPVPIEDVMAEIKKILG